MHFYYQLYPLLLALSDVAALAAKRGECKEPWEVAAAIAEDRVII